MYPFGSKTTPLRPLRAGKQDAIVITDDEPKKKRSVVHNEVFCSRATFYVDFTWDFTPHEGDETTEHGKMYVESLKPLEVTQKYPIILVHGDYYSGQIWLNKPDNSAGWASDFVNAGYHVYIVDLPLVGRSTFVNAKNELLSGPGMHYSSISVGCIENEITAPSTSNPEGWPNASFHRMWPGSGRRGDPIFDRFCPSVVALPLNRAERQKMGQNALSKLLSTTGKSILLGHGTGATMAWLAADVRPQLVAAVVAVEPSGPPYASTFTMKGKKRRYNTMFTFSHDSKAYGLADIPLSYDPPVKARPKPTRHKVKFTPLDVTMYSSETPTASYMMQEESDVFMQDPTKEPMRVRKLVNLRKVRHIVVTSHASSHSTYDWATVRFMHQAGLKVQHLQLEHFNLRGNGHLMFLELNSSQIASVLHSQIVHTIVPSPTAQMSLVKKESAEEKKAPLPNAFADVFNLNSRKSFQQEDSSTADIKFPSPETKPDKESIPVAAPTQSTQSTTDDSFLNLFDSLVDSHELNSFQSMVDSFNSSTIPSQTSLDVKSSFEVKPEVKPDIEPWALNFGEDMGIKLDNDPCFNNFGGDIKTSPFEDAPVGDLSSVCEKREPDTAGQNVPVQPVTRQTEFKPNNSVGQSAMNLLSYMRPRNLPIATSFWPSRNSADQVPKEECAKQEFTPPSDKKLMQKPNIDLQTYPAPAFAMPTCPGTAPFGNLPSPDTPSTLNTSWYNEQNDVDYNSFSCEKYKAINGSPTPVSRDSAKRMRFE